MPSDSYQGPERRGVTIHWLNARLIAVVCAVSTVTALVVCVVTLIVVQGQANTALRTSAILGCDGANLLRGVARLLTHEGKPTVPDDNNLVDSLLRVRDCETTYDEERVVSCQPAQEFQFLARLADRQRVAVREGCRRFEPIP